jgi:hypothetical protein
LPFFLGIVNSLYSGELINCSNFNGDNFKKSDNSNQFEILRNANALPSKTDLEKEGMAQLDVQINRLISAACKSLLSSNNVNCINS